MEVRLVSEEELKTFTEKLPALPTVHFKIVGVGEQTLAKHDHNPSAVCQEVEEQPGFYLIAETEETLRDAMHDLVERFFEQRKSL